MSNGIALQREVRHLNTRIAGLSQEQVKKVKYTSNERIRFTVQPSAGLWQGRRVIFEVKVPCRYPSAVCEVRCLSNVRHPNIFGSAVCLSSLEEDWRPEMRLEDYVMGVLFLMHNPNFEDPLCDAFYGLSLEAAMALVQRPLLFEQPVEVLPSL